MSTAIPCPECSVLQSNVIESRDVEGSGHIRRRRRCSNGHRFTTYERLERVSSEEATLSFIRQGIDILKDFHQFTERPEVRALLASQVDPPASYALSEAGCELHRLTGEMTDERQESAAISTPPSERARARDPHPRCGEPRCPICHPRD